MDLFICACVWGGGGLLTEGILRLPLRALIFGKAVFRRGRIFKIPRYVLCLAFFVKKLRNSTTSCFSPPVRSAPLTEVPF